MRMKSFIRLSTITSTSWTTLGWFSSFKIFASVRSESIALLPQKRYRRLLFFTAFMCLLIDFST